jgi:hypothetical protein
MIRIRDSKIQHHRYRCVISLLEVQGRSISFSGIICSMTAWGVGEVEDHLVRWPKVTIMSSGWECRTLYKCRWSAHLKGELLRIPPTLTNLACGDSRTSDIHSDGMYSMSWVMEAPLGMKRSRNSNLSYAQPFGQSQISPQTYSVRSSLY